MPTDPKPGPIEESLNIVAGAVFGVLAIYILIDMLFYFVGGQP